MRFVEPELPTLVDSPPEGDEWIHEIKHDGYRTQIHLHRGTGYAYTRNGFDWSPRYAEVIAHAEKLPVKSAVIDGEMIVQKPDGSSDYKELVRELRRKQPTGLAFVAFDLLELNGSDFRKMPLEVRRERLWQLIKPARGLIQFSQAFDGSGADLYQAADAHGLEGIVSKRSKALYRSGRSENWLKTKCFAEEDMQILGVKREAGKPAIALMASGGKYAGSAFVTLGGSQRERLWARVKAGKVKAPAGMEDEKAEWAPPGLIGRVRFLKGEEKLRHASLRELRE